MMRIVFILFIFIISGCNNKHRDTKIRDISFLSSDVIYSFSLENSSYLFHELDIIVKTSETSGFKSRYHLSIDDKSDATPDDFRINTDFSFEGNSLTDTIKVVLCRNEKIKRQSVTLKMELLSGGDFRVSEKSTLEIRFDDVVVIPYWWDNWSSYFGVYQKEKFSKWKEIYYEGADGVYYWDNMPKNPIPEIYSGTFFYLGKLKRYFEENIIYPDGDTTKERIRLP